MKVKDLLKKFENRGIHEDMDIRIIVNAINPEDESEDVFFNHLEVWGWGEDQSVDLFVCKKGAV